MRSNKPIEITMKIPFPINEPNGNGVIYIKEAIEKVVQKQKYKQCPAYDENDTIISHIEQLELSDDCEVIAHGSCYFGGTNEQGIIDNNIVSDLNFISFGICEK